MGKNRIIVIVGFLLVTMQLVIAQEDATLLTKELRCLVCQGQSIKDSDTDFAINVREVIKKKKEEGLTNQQIKYYLIERYGEEITTTPTSDHFVLWALPWLGLSVILISTLRAFYQLARVNLSRSNNRSAL